MDETLLRRVCRSLELLCIMAGVMLFLFWAGRLFVPLLPLLLGLAIAALLRPASLWLQKKAGMPKNVAAGIVLVVFYASFAALAIVFCAVMLAQFYDLLLRVPALCAEHVAPLLDQVGAWARALPGRFFPSENMRAFSQAVMEAARQAAVTGSSYLVGWAAGVVSRLPMLLLGAMCTVVISVLVSFHYENVGAFLRSLAGERFAPLLGEAGSFLRETVWQYLRAYTLLTSVTFLELLAGLWVLGFDYALSLAAVIALVDLLPLVGCGIVLAPWGIALLAVGDGAGAGLLVLYLVMGLIRNVLEPRLVSGQTGLHPVLTVACMYAGLRIGGLLGMLLAPVMLLAFLRLGRFYWGVNAPGSGDVPPQQAHKRHGS